MKSHSNTLYIYEPHKGEFYEKGIDGDRYLFVAGSHHCLPKRHENSESKYGECPIKDPSKCIGYEWSDPKFKCPAFDKKCPLLDICKSHKRGSECEYRKKLICETKLCIYDHIHEKTEPNFIFSRFYRFRDKLIKNGILVSGKDEDIYSLWSMVCFQNYVQKITTNLCSDQEILEDKYVDDTLNVQAFIENLKNIRPKVVVVLYFKSVKKKIEKILRSKSFREIKQLSEDNMFYVFAKTSSKLYKRYDDSLLGNYRTIIYKLKEFYSEEIVSAAVTYHILVGDNKIDDIDRRVEIYKKFKDDDYNFFINKDPETSLNTFHQNYNRLVDYIIENKPNKSPLHKCYNIICEYFKKLQKNT
jgi:hypothetical protein